MIPVGRTGFPAGLHNGAAGTGAAGKTTDRTRVQAPVALAAACQRESVKAVGTRHGLHSNQLGRWKRQLIESWPEVFAGGGHRRVSKPEVTGSNPVGSIGIVGLGVPMLAD